MAHDSKDSAADRERQVAGSGPQGLVLSSGRLGWEHITLTHWEGVVPQEVEEDALARHLIVIHLTPEPVGVLEKGDDLHAEGITRPGDINLFSAGERSYCRWDRALSFLRLDLSPDYLRRRARHLTGSARACRAAAAAIRLSTEQLARIDDLAPVGLALGRTLL
jgi:AraC family transcriptional regulator